MNSEDLQTLKAAVKRIMDKSTKSITYNMANYGEVKSISVEEGGGFTSGGWLQVRGSSWSDLVPLNSINKIDCEVNDKDACITLIDWLTSHEITKYIIRAEFA